MMRARRGSALILVLLMTLAVAGLAVAAIFMSSSAGLLSRFYDRERDFRLAAESALELGRSRLSLDETLAIPDTGMRQLLAGHQFTDAAGAALTRARVNLFAATTGDTSGRTTPHVTLVAVAYDANGTRHVRRLDLRRESFARYTLLTDSFPSTLAHGPATVSGRVHSNGWWRTTTSGNRFRDTVTAVSGFSGIATYDVDSTSGVVPIAYPKDSTFAWMHTRATAANLAFTPVTGATRASHLEFVAFDADGDGTVEVGESFARVFDLANDASVDTSRFRANPAVSAPFLSPSTRFHRWDDVVVQNQCGAFYRFGGAWHFFPIAAHRADYVRNALTAGGAGRYPVVNGGMMNRLDDYSYDAAAEILELPTSRCFPAGSPYLMPTERLTNAAGVVTGTASDTRPFGAAAPPGGWPAAFPNGYGGSDTTFTHRPRTCTFPQSDDPSPWTCSGARDLGAWRAFGGTAVSGVPGTVRQAGELAYLWPLGTAYNANSRGIISAAGPLFVSGTVRGPVTLRVAGSVVIADRLRMQSGMNNPDSNVCEDRFGLLAVGDILVADGLVSRVRRIGRFGALNLTLAAYLNGQFGGEPRFTMQGAYMSLTGTVGVENPGVTNADAGAQLPCPEDGGAASRTNGGCLELTGSAAMRVYSGLYTTTSNSGHRYRGIPDACMAGTNRPPFFPLTNRYRVVRTLEVEPSLANTPAKVRALLMRLKGIAL